MSRNKQQIIAIVFDFDDTLGPDSTSGFLDSCGVDVRQFWKDTAKLHKDSWDPVPAYLYKMIKLAQTPDTPTPITRSLLQEWGKKAPLYPGVPEVFDDLKSQVRHFSKDIKLEFYIISSGIQDVVSNSSIAHHFTDIWASDFSYDEQDRAHFPKRVVSYTDKTRYIFHVSKGLTGKKGRQHPFEVNRKYHPEEIRIPIDQMIFVGDGFTDIPCFSLVGKKGGISLAVCDPADRDKWGRAWGFMEDKRVVHWATANYRKGSTLYASMMMALETLSKKIVIKNRSYQG